MGVFFTYMHFIYVGYTFISLETGKDDVQIYLHNEIVTRLTAEFSRRLLKCVYMHSKAN